MTELEAYARSLRGVDLSLWTMLLRMARLLVGMLPLALTVLLAAVPSPADPNTAALLGLVIGIGLAGMALLGLGMLTVAVGTLVDRAIVWRFGG